MNLARHRPEMTAARKRAEETFAERLKASGRERGVFAAKKNDAEGELLIYDVIGEDFWTGGGVTATGVSEQLAALKGVKTLNVYINSPGGSVWEGKAIYNQIARFPAEKIVHVDGIASSAASLIAMAGNRIITEPGGTWLVHEVANPWTEGRGTADDHEKMATQIRAETVAILGIYEQRTKCPPERLVALMREDRIITAAEAKEYGLTDEISEAEQKRAAAAAASAPRASLSPSVTADLARARVRALHEKFGGASPARKPGEPGATKHTAAPKENKP